MKMTSDMNKQVGQASHVNWCLLFGPFLQHTILQCVKFHQ